MRVTRDGHPIVDEGAAGAAPPRVEAILRPDPIIRPARITQQFKH